MSGRKLVNANYNSSTDWEDETESKNVLKKGEYNLVFTDMTATAIDQILEGSSIEIAGVVYVFDTDYSPTGTPADGIVYLYIEESGGVAVGVWTATPPAVYNFERKGFYNSGGTQRYVYRAVKASAVYTEKVIMEGMIPKSNTITSLYDGVANVDKYLQFASDANIYWDESEDKFVVDKILRVGDDLSVGGDLSVDGSIALSSVKLTRTLEVDGIATFNNNIIDKNGNEVEAMITETKTGVRTTSGTLTLTFSSAIKGILFMDITAGDNFLASPASSYVNSYTISGSSLNISVTLNGSNDILVAMVTAQI